MTYLNAFGQAANPVIQRKGAVSSRIRICEAQRVVASRAAAPDLTLQSSNGCCIEIFGVEHLEPQACVLLDSHFISDTHSAHRMCVCLRPTLVSISCTSGLPL